jgi:hypothetical protein
MYRPGTPWFIIIGSGCISMDDVKRCSPYQQMYSDAAKQAQTKISFLIVHSV